MTNLQSDPVQQTKFPSSTMDEARATHFLLISLFVVADVAALFQKRPWDWRFAGASALLTFVAVFVYVWRRQVIITASILAAAIVLGCLSLFVHDPIFQKLVWVIYGTVLWATSWECLRGSPDITERAAIKWTLAAAALAVLLAYLLYRFAHFEDWSVLSTGLIFGCALFAAFTPEE